jgi:hypothetical protein
MIVSAQVTFRDNMGRFMGLCDAAARTSAEELAQQMERRAKRRAPSGPARDDYGRRMKLRPSISAVILGRAWWAVVARAEHAEAIEKGAGPHMIPNAFGRGVPVLHPGNAAQPYLLPSYEAARASWRRILAKNYPG